MTLIKNILFAILLITIQSSCGHRDKRESVGGRSIDHVVHKKNNYIELIGDAPQEITTRCDSLTFIGLYHAFGKKVNIYDYEYPEGKWNRDEKPCYPDYSRSEISLESALGALHAIYSDSNKDALTRFRVYAEKNNWTLGEGPAEYTYLIHLLPIIRAFSGQYELLSEDPYETLASYRGSVIADYIFLFSLARGYITDAEIEILEILADSNPDNPFFSALLHRFTDGIFDTAIDICENDELFPVDDLPGTNEHIFNWSDAPAAILYITTASIIEGTPWTTKP